MMKIETVIPLRKDGTVKVTTPAGAKYVFEMDEFGRVVAEVADESTIAWMLEHGDFFPAEEDDYDAAAAITGAADEDDAADDPVNMDAAPIESPAAPPAATKRGSKKGK